MGQNKHLLIVIVGPTACGKTALAVNIAHQLNGEIISADSRQVYKHLNIGTGKDYSAYLINNQKIPYHLIDICEPGEKYHVYQFQKDFFSVYNDIISRTKQPILCGGTGLYIESVLHNFEFTAIPVNETLQKKLEAHSHESLLQLWNSLPIEWYPNADTSTKKRTIRAIEIVNFLKNNPIPPRPQLFDQKPIEYVVFGILPSREQRRQAISERLKLRLEQGLVEEVDRLMKSGLSYHMLQYYGLEYKWVSAYLMQQVDYPTMVARLEVAIHQFAKRQMTYFRKMENSGIKIHWIEHSLSAHKKIDCILNTIRGN